jgi:hypothetical protein
MSIIPDLTHPAWCGTDLPTDDGGVIHLSASRAVIATTSLSGFIHVSVERLDTAGRPGAPSIRIEGHGDELTPLAAFELASSLQAAAIAALMGDAR